MAQFTLTDSADTITGTANDDTFEGGTASLQTADVIEGLGGNDTLTAGTEPNGTQAPTISGVETIELDTAGPPCSIANITGAETISTNGASIILEDVAQDDLETRFGALDVSSGTVTFRFTDGALEAMDDVLRLLVDTSNVTFTSDSSFDSTADGEQNATPDTERVETISIRLEGTSTETQFDNQVDVSAFTAIERLVLSGPAESKIVVSSPELELIYARFASGGMSVSSDIANDQRVITGSGDDDLATGSGDDTINALAGNDTINAGSGNNRVLAGAGDDVVTSEGGNDRIFGGTGGDEIDSGSGDDFIRSGDGNDMIGAGDGADIVNGDDGDDMIDGGGGADRLFDGDGNDTVMGGSDNDVFLIGGGNDVLNGGGGQDIFIFTGAELGSDTVEDFQLTSTTATNDVVVFNFAGEQTKLRSQDSFEAFYDANESSGRVTADANTDTVTIEADGGTLTLNVSDADFLLA